MILEPIVDPKYNVVYLCYKKPDCYVSVDTAYDIDEFADFVMRCDMALRECLRRTRADAPQFFEEYIETLEILDGI